MDGERSIGLSPASTLIAILNEEPVPVDERYKHSTGAQSLDRSLPEKDQVGGLSPPDLADLAGALRRYAGRPAPVRPKQAD